MVVVCVTILLDVRNLKTAFFNKKQKILVVDGIDLKINKGETVALVGESGCGKSITSLSIMGLVPSPNGKIVAGEIKLDGVDLLGLTEKKMCEIRGKEISMIFQDPMNSLNPVMKIGDQLTEVLMYHQKLKLNQAVIKSIDFLNLVGFSNPEEVMNNYPHRLSGGMRQRVMIAMAMICNPKLLIADEPTTALDVTIQAQVLELMKELNEQFETSILLITHDLGVVSELAERVVVIYGGQVMEESPIDELFDDPLHPYTKGLIDSVPSLDGKIERLNSIPGSVPVPEELPNYCRFASRCSKAFDRCFSEQPSLQQIDHSRSVRCFIYEDKEV